MSGGYTGLCYKYYKLLGWPIQVGSPNRDDSLEHPKHMFGLME